MEEYNSVMMELKLFKSSNLNFNKIKDYYESFKIELNDCKKKCKTLEEENKKLKEEQKKEIKVQEKKDNAKSSKNLTIIDLSKRISVPINEIYNLNYNSKGSSKTIKDEDHYPPLKRYNSSSEENLPTNNYKQKETKRSIHFLNTPLKKITTIIEEEDEDRPDSEFLRKIRMYSNNKEKIESKINKSSKEEINKFLFKGISSADKTKENNKEEKMSKAMERFKRTRENNSEEKLNEDKLSKTTKIKKMASLLEEQINKNFNEEKREKEEGEKIYEDKDTKVNKKVENSFDNKSEVIKKEIKEE